MLDGIDVAIIDMRGVIRRCTEQAVLEHRLPAEETAMRTS